MTLKEALSYAHCQLENRNIDDAALESELLLRQALNLSRPQLYSDTETELTPVQQTAFNSLLERRLNGEPNAYIRGRREFYGLDFYVDRRVLIPRPESEMLVDEALKLTIEYTSPVVADIGCGCGAIAISLALKLPKAKIYATDISATALEVAAHNCRRHGVTHRVILLEGNLLEPLPEVPDIIAANLPYVNYSDVNQNTSEPKLALNGGDDGTDVIRQLCQQAARLRPNSSLLLEIGQGQEEIVKELLKSLFPVSIIEVKADLAGIPRLVSLRPITRS